MARLAGQLQGIERLDTGDRSSCLSAQVCPHNGVYTSYRGHQKADQGQQPLKKTTIQGGIINVESK